MKKSRTHVVFSKSIAGTLRQGLKSAAYKDVVISLGDDFSFGPISCNGAESRSEWVKNVLDCDDWEDIVEDNDKFLNESINSSGDIIAWLSPDSSRSISGFLWWLSHIGYRECLMVDGPCLSSVNPDIILQRLDRAKILSKFSRKSHLALWRQLQEENAPFRVLSDSGLLVSAQIEFFDSILLEHVAPEWRKMARVIGDVLGTFFKEGIDQTSSLVLAARLADLAEDGKLEWRGDLNDIVHCEVRASTLSG